MPTLDWLNRAQAFTTAARVPYRLLEEVSIHSAGAPDETAPATALPAQADLLQPQDKAPDRLSPTSGNLLIQGDNLEALKALLPFYRGQVKCIFIDPPYNTQSAFEHYDDNLEHAQWLSMMLPRLQLLRELLSEDGSIWVTIDDNEGHYLKVLMDEVFGRGNFLTTFIWQKSYGGGAKARYFVGLHEYIHCYAKNMSQLPDFFWPPDEGVLKYYKLQDSKVAMRGPYRLQPLATTSNDERPNLRYALPSPDGNEVWPTKQWQWSKERALIALKNDELVFTKSKGGYTVNYKQYLKDADGEERRAKPKSIIEGRYTQHGTYESVELFGQEQKFAFPKPEGVIERILEAATNPNDLILDSFLGSGTTAAVAHKMGRRWIGIEMGEHAATHCLPRLQKVINGEQGGISKAVNWQGGGGFRFMTLGAPIFDEHGRIHPDVRFATLAAFIWQQETGSAWHADAAQAGTPYLGTHYQLDSFLRTPDVRESPISCLKVPKFACYLLFNGILGDKRPASGNVLTRDVLDALLALHAQTPDPAAPLLVFGEACRLGPERLKQANVTFRHIPYDVKAR
ncbi:adenine-specific DNA-methyltransferase [Polaromonas sp. CG_9.5]|uniref:site-specific DNA-methyltransferase n=1 Tax=Polaromonas sp. CG_9.5 TaxID=3071705 RepID=UPI002E0262B8|nr:adenine-specific DNA-methyltransferase [Polaromonas sp. CG_9.5]